MSQFANEGERNLNFEVVCVTRSQEPLDRVREGEVVVTLMMSNHLNWRPNLFRHHHRL